MEAVEAGGVSGRPININNVALELQDHTRPYQVKMSPLKLGAVEKMSIYICLKLKLIDIEEYMNEVCKDGHIETVKFLVKNGASDWNSYATSACIMGRLEVIKFIVQKSMESRGNTDGADGTDGAATFSNTNLEDFMYCACLRGDSDFVAVLLKMGVTCFNKGLFGASKKGHVDLVKVMIECGATNLNESLERSYIIGNYGYEDVAVISVLVSSGANKLDRLSNTNDFKLHCVWLKYKGIKPDRRNRKWLRLVTKYPPCVLLTGCRSEGGNGDGNEDWNEGGKKQCHLKRLPNDLFVLLSKY